MNICKRYNLKVLFLLVSNVFSALTISVLTLLNVSDQLKWEKNTITGFPGQLEIALENESHYTMQMLTHQEDIPPAYPTVFSDHQGVYDESGKEFEDGIMREGFRNIQ